jgi:hypothetical protein
MPEGTDQVCSPPVYAKPFQTRPAETAVIVDVSAFVHVTFRRKAFVPAVRSAEGTEYVAAV